MLIDAFTHFKVHTSAIEKVCRKECPNTYIYQAILARCKKAVLNLHYASILILTVGHDSINYNANCALYYVSADMCYSAILANIVNKQCNVIVNIK